MKTRNILFAACFAALLVISGCTTLAPGADPLVVRAEQLETTANASFDLVVAVDNANRGFWLTNAPAFHQFAEWLRAKVPVPNNADQRRGVAMILLVDSAKLTYQANHSQSNLLIQAVSDLQAAANQAAAWSTIVKTPTP